MTARLSVLVSGEVQGVGFRYWVRREAEPLGLAGSATNLPDGRVEIVAEGPRVACEQLLAELRAGAAPGRVTDLEVQWGQARGEGDGFRVR